MKGWFAASLLERSWSSRFLPDRYSCRQNYHISSHDILIVTALFWPNPGSDKLLSTSRPTSLQDNTLPALPRDSTSRSLIRMMMMIWWPNHDMNMIRWLLCKTTGRLTGCFKMGGWLLADVFSFLQSKKIYFSAFTWGWVIVSPN